MKKILTIVFICVLLMIIDNTLVPFFAIRGFYPSLLFIFCLFYSIINGSWEGIWIGILSGVLQDLYFINGFGINTFTNMLLCALAGFIGVSIFKEKSLIPIVSCFFMTVIKGILVFSILYIVKMYTSFEHIIYNSLYSVVVSIFMYKRVYRLCQKEYMQRKWSFYDR
ncbi:rod shape-determining protein MreD [Clostridium sp. SYSU_GA19001]|uniref:rod shape-determining protein MreD n=1 Tax=Clostridium caldaquaticum TaxID=2940653 RepID=UPI002076FFDE|nr:rod shape-determining protein MreD [Clostridium caldaquaticum]MCM8710367.1 rod shape-determining protein MreD [Clostridium caldaquaticum]